MQRDDRLRNLAELGIRTEHIIGLAKRAHTGGVQSRFRVIYNIYYNKCLSYVKSRGIT